jgi:hypothetical protein
MITRTEQQSTKQNHSISIGTKSTSEGERDGEKAYGSPARYREGESFAGKRVGEKRVMRVSLIGKTRATKFEEKQVYFI